MSQKEIPHLFISVMNRLPVLETEGELKDIQTEKLNIQLQRFEPQAYACLEWFIPTAIGLYITKSYFGAFFQEMGKDHYLGLKSWFSNLIGPARKLKIRAMASDQSPLKLSKEQSQSGGISLDSDTKTGHRLRFLFDERLSEEIWHKCMHDAFNIVEEHFSDGENDLLSREIRNKVLNKYVFGIINLETYEWEFVNQ